MEAFLSELETALGCSFSQPELLLRALTHRSYVNKFPAIGEQVGGDNERLEFLGDAVLGLIVGETLFSTHPDWSEGELTRVRAQLVSRKHMAEVANAIGLGDHLRVSQGEDHGGLRRTTTVLSNSMEAVIGALYLDGGLEPVRTFVHRMVMGEAEQELARELRSGAALGNFKSALQEYLQSMHAGIPVYNVKSESGPDHRKRFVIEVRSSSAEGELSQPLAQGSGSTKKLAEQDAARRALSGLSATPAKAKPGANAGPGEGKASA